MDARLAALDHLRLALKTGIRGVNRDAIEAAVYVLEGDGRRGGLTDIHYRNLKPGAKLFDPARPGLIMRNGARTGRVWIYRYEHPSTGKQVELQFGRYPALALAEARELWSQLRRQRLDGNVPALAAQGTASLFLSDLVDNYLEQYAKIAKRPSSVAEDRRLLERHLLPNFGQLPALEFQHAQAIECLRPLLDRKAFREAEKLRAVLLTMFNVAIKGTRKVDLGDKRWLPPTTINPIEAVSIPRPKTERHIPLAGELRNYVRGLSQLGKAGDILRLQLLTGSRISEVAELPWQEIDLEGGVWTLPASRAKNGHAHRVMLSPEAVSLIAAQQGNGSPYVFPSPTDKHRPSNGSEVQRCLADNRKLIGVSEGFTNHAIRHALLTWVAENGGSKDIRDRLVNHVTNGDVDSIYNRATHDKAARQWLVDWANYLTSLTIVK